MFNNTKYKIKNEVIDPIIKHIETETVKIVKEDYPYKNIKHVLQLYKPMSFLSKMYHIPMLLKTIYINLKKIYNDN